MDVGLEQGRFAPPQVWAAFAILLGDGAVTLYTARAALFCEITALAWVLPVCLLPFGLRIARGWLSLVVLLGTAFVTYLYLMGAFALFGDADQSTMWLHTAVQIVGMALLYSKAGQRFFAA